MTNATRPFINNATRKEREELLREAQLPTTYHHLAGLDDDLGGRFRVKETIAGEQAATQYPRQPEASPWAGDPVGLEPPLGVEINAQEPTGEAHEIEKSLAALPEAPTLAVSSTAVAVVKTGNAANPKTKRRKLR
jgi:hypothetical protein